MFGLLMAGAHQRSGQPRQHHRLVNPAARVHDLELKRLELLVEPYVSVDAAVIRHDASRYKAFDPVRRSRRVASSIPLTLSTISGPFGSWVTILTCIS